MLMSAHDLMRVSRVTADVAWSRSSVSGDVLSADLQQHLQTWPPACQGQRTSRADYDALPFIKTPHLQICCMAFA